MNPYESPKHTDDDVEEATEQKHRSFRLTTDAPLDSASPHDPFRKAVFFSFAVQAAALFMSALVLDSGMMFNGAVFTSIVFCLLLFYLGTRETRTNTAEILFTKLGYIPIVITVWFFTNALTGQ